MFLVDWQLVQMNSQRIGRRTFRERAPQDLAPLKKHAAGAVLCTHDEPILRICYAFDLSKRL
jgi:hypothetical protein